MLDIKAAGEEFPKSVNLEDPSVTFCSCWMFWQLQWGKTIFAAAGNDDLRPVMSGVFFNSLTRRINVCCQADAFM